VASDFHQKFKPKEWDDVKVLVMHACSPNVLIGKKAARTLEDLQGYTLRAPGRMGDTVKALGGTPRPTPMAETYEGMSKGVLHGVTTPLETLKTWRFAEVASHVTLSWEVGNVQHFYVVMNKKKYQDLPDEVRKVFDELSVDFAERFAKMWVEIDFEGRDYAKEKGVELIQLSDSETKRWKQAVKPVIDNFVKDMKDKGVSESEATGYIAYIQERIAYWTQKQIEMGIKSVTGPEGMRAK
jgi:TRAP-type C4-dicarboxylate transport system substrate-binding protein